MAPQCVLMFVTKHVKLALIYQAKGVSLAIVHIRTSEPIQLKICVCVYKDTKLVRMEHVSLWAVPSHNILIRLIKDVDVSTENILSL